MEPRRRIITAIVAQFRRPTGLAGRAAGWVMANRASNRRRNVWAVSLLEVQPSDRILEIGFGPGLAVRELSRLAPDGYVCGIDHSEVMLQRARRLNAAGIARGQVDLRLGSVEDLPHFDQPFDRILTVNSMLFWRDPVARLAELRRLLRSGGTLAVVHQPRGPTASDGAAAAAGRELEAALAQAGFSEIRLENLLLKPTVVCALGMNGPAPSG